MTQRAEGHLVWHVPDCYLPEKGSDVDPGHEAFCVLNVGDTDAAVEIGFYFEDREPIVLSEQVPARRARHVRTDALPDGVELERLVPYAARLVSNVPVSVQYSRLDVAPGHGLMTTMALPIAD